MMPGLTVTVVTKDFFFDKPYVMRHVDRARRRVLSRFGAYVRRTAMWSIRRRKKVSEPGKPPSSHSGDLKHGILFGYDVGRESVVIGPMPLHGKDTKDALELLEYGGRTKLRKPRYMRVGPAGRDAAGRFTQGKMVKLKRGTRLRYKARPFMGPALEKEKPKLPQMWRDSVR